MAAPALTDQWVLRGLRFLPGPGSHHDWLWWLGSNLVLQAVGLLALGPSLVGWGRRPVPLQGVGAARRQQEGPVQLLPARPGVQQVVPMGVRILRWT